MLHLHNPISASIFCQTDVIQLEDFNCRGKNICTVDQFTYLGSSMQLELRAELFGPRTSELLLCY